MGYQKCASALISDRFSGLTEAYFEANPDDFPPKTKDFGNFKQVSLARSQIKSKDF